ncbi:MAG TPA: hypothetical protein ENK57_03295 [Polyangiaceae bacterium]|nr:hypothetical protein [Polyangiaceae bacterium]
MSDPIRRALRTFAQAFIGILLGSELLPGIVVSGQLPDSDAVERLFVSAAAAGFIALLAWVQNTLEDATGRNVLPK